MVFNHTVPRFLGNGQKYKHFCFIPLKIWSRRLTVRTPGSHPGNRSSILRGITTKTAHPTDGLFSWLVFVENRTPKECDNEEKGREVYLPERDDGIF